MTFMTKWINTGNIHDFVFLGKEIIATACGNYVIFYNLLTKEKRIEYFNSPLRGEGACCLAGHQVMPIFSTAERRFCPKIYIHTYPELRKVAECKLYTDLNAYLSCCFVGTEYLVSLTSYPHFELIIWLWRSGEKIYSIETTVMDMNQIIEVSIYASQMLCQFSPSSGKLWTYEILTYSKKVTVIRNNIKISEKKITSVHWLNSGNLMLSDSLQNVYIIGVDGRKCQLILRRDLNIKSINNFLILPYSNSFFTVDNDSKLSFYNTSYLENNCETWNLTWSIQCQSHPLKMVLARHKEAIFIYCRTGEILELDLMPESKLSFEKIYTEYQKIKYLCVLEPDEVNVAVLDFSNCLYIIDVFTGNLISNTIINQEDQVMCMVSHPLIPLVAVTTSTGKVMFFIKSDVNLVHLKTLYLQKESLTKIRFARNGFILGISSTVTKYFFMLKTIVTEKIDVYFYTKFTKFIIDFLIFENEQKMILLVLSQTNADIGVSNCIEIYKINAEENIISEKRLILTNHFYRHLNYSSEKYGDFLGLPYLSKKIELFQFEDDFQSINLFKTWNSTHKIRQFHIATSKEYLLTSGLDGFIVLRSYSNQTKIIKTFMIHHYQDRGLKLSILSLKHNIVISLSNNGCLICIMLSETEEVRKLKSSLDHKAIRNFIRLQQDKLKANENIVWIEIEELKINQTKMNNILVLKNNLLKDWQSLKQKVQTILDLNEMKSIECRIPISSFDLNSQRRQEKVDSSAISREAEQIKLQNIINKKEAIINYLICQFWNTLEVHDCCLTSFNSEIVVKNYKLYHFSKQEKMLDFFIELFDIPLSNKIIKSNNKIIDKGIHEILTDRKTLSKNITTTRNILSSKHNNDTMLSGTTSYRYIVNDITSNQLSNVDYNTNSLQLSREYQLKVYFNNKFNEMKCLKKKVIDETKQQLYHLNAYQKEMHDIFGVTVEIPYNDDSNWQSDESLSNLITTTLQNSLSNNQSINILNSNYLNTPQDLSNSIDHSAMNYLPEHERSFRKDKLIEMMDGLLEIRWEDKIKKNVTKPYCMLFKHPSKYTNEDIEAVAIYKLKVDKLRIEREKYKAHLEFQIESINDKMKAEIESFDNKMEEFSLEKIKVQSAISQEFLLKLNKQKQQFFKDNENKSKSHIIDNERASLENENKMLISELLKVEPIVVELRNKYDNLKKRDKILEAKFKSDFSDLKQPLVEHLLRQYKRRPKINEINCAPLTCLIETNKCLIDGKKSVILPHAYLEFLKGMDALDIMPSSLPQQIDGNYWQLLCKLRRNKVEMEIKLKVAALELAETEQTYFHLQKLSSQIQSKIYFIKNRMEEEALKNFKSYKNSKIQLILKAGQIEIPLIGSIKDFEISIVVTYDELVQINVDIVKEGQKKIAAMRAAMFVQKSILYRNWKYQCMSTKLKHLQEQLIILRNIKISKNMQNYLVERLKGNIHYRDATSCGKILSSTEKKFQRMLKEEKTILRRIVKEIKYWRKENEDLTNKIQLFKSLKQQQKFELEENQLQKRNSAFHKHNLCAIMERTSLIEKLKENRNELLNLQTQLELLKLKSYPTLRLKDICHHIRSNDSMKS